MTSAPGHLRMLVDDDRDGLGPIVPVPLDRFEEAINRLVGGPQASPEAGRQFLAVATDAGVDLRRLWVRISPQDRVVASVLCVPNAGKAAMVFASQVTNETEQAEVAPVIDRACIELHHEPLCIAQALVDPGDRLMESTFNQAGFDTLAQLSYMDRPLNGRRVPPAPVWPDNVQVRQYDSSLEDDVLAALDASYEGTLDCPRLRGLRSTADILAGHEATGRFDPALWTLLLVDDQPSGVLFLNPAPASNVIELVYLGLAPKARRRGLGRMLLHHGLRLVAGRHERAMTLAVDDQNDPALSLYRREGFRRMLRRHAMLRPLRAKEAT